jgi:hypothetical protein
MGTGRVTPAGIQLAGRLIQEVNLDVMEEYRTKGIYGRHHRRPEPYGPLCDVAGQIHPEDANLPEEGGG